MSISEEQLIALQEEVAAIRERERQEAEYATNPPEDS